MEEVEEILVGNETNLEAVGNIANTDLGLKMEEVEDISVGNETNLETSEYYLAELERASDNEELGRLIPENPIDRSKAMREAVGKYLCRHFGEQLIKRMKKWLRQTPLPNKQDIHLWFACTLPKACKAVPLKLKYPKKKGSDDTSQKGQKKWCFSVASTVVKVWVEEGVIRFEPDGTVMFIAPEITEDDIPVENGTATPTHSEASQVQPQVDPLENPAHVAERSQDHDVPQSSMNLNLDEGAINDQRWDCRAFVEERRNTLREAPTVRSATPMPVGDRDSVTINLSVGDGSTHSVLLQLTWKALTNAPHSSVNFLYGPATRIECGISSPVLVILVEYTVNQAMSVHAVKYSVDAHRERVRSCPDHFEPVIDFLPCVAIAHTSYAVITLGAVTSLATYLIQNGEILQAQPAALTELSRQLVRATQLFDQMAEPNAPSASLWSPYVDVLVRHHAEDAVPRIRFGPLLSRSFSPHSDWVLHRVIRLSQNAGHIMAFILTLGKWRPHQQDLQVPANLTLAKQAAKKLLDFSPGDSITQREFLRAIRTHPAFWQDRDIVTFTLNINESLSITDRDRMNRMFRPVPLASSPILAAYLIGCGQDDSASSYPISPQNMDCAVSELFRLARNGFSHLKVNPALQAMAIAHRLSRTKQVELSARNLRDTFPLLFEQLWVTRFGFGWSVAIDPCSQSVVFEFGIHDSKFQ